MRKHPGNYAIPGAVVVVLLILLLAAILWPIHHGSGRKADQTRCTSNQRQIALAMEIYTQEHNNVCPDALNPTLFAATVLTCPTAPTVKIGYGYNRFLAGKSLKAISSPADILLTADTGKSNADHFISSFSDIEVRHKGGFVASYLDGHIAFMQAGSPIKMQ